LHEHIVVDLNVALHALVKRQNVVDTEQIIV